MFLICEMGKILTGFKQIFENKAVLACEIEILN